MSTSNAIGTASAASSCSIDALRLSLHLRDAYTGGHCDRVGRLGGALCRFIGLDDAEIAHLELAARFHDIGKIGTPDAVLLSPHRHDDTEQAIMREHPVHGEAIFLATGRDDAIPVARLIRAHHEAFDGSGYPDGLGGEAIPLGARMLTIVDAYDAMTSNRPYRQAMPAERALRILQDSAGGLVDPYLLRQFQQMVQRAPSVT